jgi:transcriptional antiterminator NusG
MAIELKKDYSSEFRWYTIQTYSGSEIQAKVDLETRITAFHMSEFINKVIAPTEEIIEKKKNGVEKKVVKMLFPGYIFVEMKMTQDSWFIVRNTPHITGLLGSSGKGTLPVPVPKREIEKILSRIGEIEKSSFDHYIGKIGKITSGSFAGQTCEVKDVTRNAQGVTLNVEIFTNFNSNVFDVEIDLKDFSLMESVD